MNILVICHYSLYQNFSFSFVHNQIREYAKLGHRVRVVIPNGLGKVGRDGKRIGKQLIVSEIDQVELYDVRYFTASKYGEKKFNTESAKFSIRCLQKKIFFDFKPDVVHAHTLGFDSEIGAWLKRKFSCPLVVTTHGSDAEIPLSKGEKERVRAYCDNADKIVAVSSKLADRVRSCGTKTPVITVHNGFVAHSFKDEGRDPKRIIQVGNLIPSKRVNITIRALARLKQTFPEMNLFIVGQGPEREKLEALCEELEVKDAVTFAGQLDNADVFRELQKSNFFVMASKPEGFGIVYLEAMAAGCITIGTQGEGIQDIIVSEQNGFLVPADDPQAIVDIVENCLADEKKAKSISEGGKATASQLTWENNAKKYLDMFEQE